MKAGPSVLFTASFGAGLATGLALFWAGLAAIGAAALALLLRGRDPMVVPAAFLLGLVHGAAGSRLAEGSCPSQLPPGQVSVTIRLSGAAAPGVVDGTPVGFGCRGPVALMWPRGVERPAGSAVRVEGRWLPSRTMGGRPSGVLLVRSVGPAAGHPGFRARLAGSITRSAGRLFGPRAPMVDALVLGRRGGIPRTLRDSFARSGLVHLLSISGFHVGLLAGWVLLLLRACRVNRAAAGLGASLAATAYVAFLGWPAPATRAAALAWLAAIAAIRQRRLQPAPLLATTALAVMLVDPWAVFDLGGWLSVAALWGATRFTRWSDAALSRRRPVRMVFASCGAVLATAPFTAAAFGSVALVGIVLNFAAIPLAAVAVPGILVSLLLAPVLPGVAGTIAGGTGLALAGLERLAILGGDVPGGSITAVPGWTSGLGWAAVLAAGCWIVAPRVKGRQAGARLAGVATAVVWGHLVLGLLERDEAGRGQLSLFFLDVGQGDAAAIRTPGGQWVLVDAGPIGPGRDAGREIVAPFLVRHGARSLRVLLISHAHADHFGGAGSAMDRLAPSLILEPGWPAGDSLYLALLDRLEAEQIPWHAGRSGDRWELDGVRFSLVHPDSTWDGWGEDLNEDSLVLLVEYRAFRALFMGDAGLPAERRLRGRVGRVTVLKAGHHGSATASSAGWLAELAPAAAVLSVGPNRYGHPHRQTLARIAAAGATLWRTDRDGTVTVRTDGRLVRISGRSRRQEITLPAPPAGPP